MTVDPSAVTEAGGASAGASELAPGSSVGKYRLDRVLGAGGMGPFAGKTLDELRAAAGTGARPDARIPPRVHAVLARGLAGDPAARWPDMHVLLRELEAAIVPPPPRRSRVPWITASFLG